MIQFIYILSYETKKNKGTERIIIKKNYSDFIISVCFHKLTRRAFNS